MRVMIFREEEREKKVGEIEREIKKCWNDYEWEIDLQREKKRKEKKCMMMKLNSLFRVASRPSLIKERKKKENKIKGKLLKA